MVMTEEHCKRGNSTSPKIVSKIYIHMSIVSFPLNMISIAVSIHLVMGLSAQVA